MKFWPEIKGVTCLKRAPWKVIVPSVLKKLWEVENYLFSFVRVFKTVWVVWVGTVTVLTGPWVCEFCVLLCVFWELWLVWEVLWVLCTFRLLWEFLWVVWVLWALRLFWVLALGLEVVVVVTFVAGCRLIPWDDEEDELCEEVDEDEEEEDWELFWVDDDWAALLWAILWASTRLSFPLYSKE